MVVGALLVRLVGFFSALMLFPRSVLPFTVRLGLIASGIVFALPMLLALSGPAEPQTFGTLLAEISSQGVNQFSAGWSVLLSELTIGVASGALISFSGYGALLIAGWLSTMLYGDAAREDAEMDLRGRYALNVVRYGTILLFVTVVLHSDAIVALFVAFAESLQLVPLSTAASATLSTERLATIVADVGQKAFVVALVVAMPVFLVAIISDFIVIVAARYMPTFVSGGTAPALRIPVILMVLSLLTYSGSSAVSRLVLQSVEDPVLEIADDG